MPPEPEDAEAAFRTNYELTVPLLQAVANASHLPTPFLNSFALAYTASRVLYNLVYYNQIGFFSDSARTGTSFPSYPPRDLR